MNVERLEYVIAWTAGSGLGSVIVGDREGYLLALFICLAGIAAIRMSRRTLV